VICRSACGRGVFVGVAVAVSVLVAVNVAVEVAVLVGVLVAVKVAADVAVLVGMLVLVGVAVLVANNVVVDVLLGTSVPVVETTVAVLVNAGLDVDNFVGVKKTKVLVRVGVDAGRSVDGICVGAVIFVGKIVALGTRVGMVCPGVRKTLIQTGGVRMAGSMSGKAKPGCAVK